MPNTDLSGNRPDCLVTGAGGFIGQPLTARLGARTFTRSDGDLSSDSEALFRACEGVTKMVHLAYPSDYESPTGEAMDMLLNVISVCLERGIHLFLPSSWRVFDGLSGAITAATAPNSMTDYGRAKIAEETAALESGVRLTIVRLANIYGPASQRPRIIRDFTRAIRMGEPVRPHRFENGYPGMDLIHVSDAVEGIAALVSAGADGIFHLGSGDATPTPEIAGIIARNIGCSYRQEDEARDGQARRVALVPSEGFSPQRSLGAGLGEMAFLPV